MMNDRLDDILNECLEALESGRMTLSECLQKYPQYRQPLEELLGLAMEVRSAATVEPRAAFRRSARARLTARLNDLPVVTNRNPLRLLKQISTQPIQWSRRMVMNWIAILVLLASLFGGGAAVQASAQALPDSPLYPLKTGIESLRLAVSSEPTQTQLALEFANRRLEEAGQLIEKQAYEYLPEVVAGYWQLTRQALEKAAVSGNFAEFAGNEPAELIAVQVDTMTSLLDQLPPDQLSLLEESLPGETPEPLPGEGEEPPAGEPPLAACTNQTHPVGVKLAVTYAVPYEDVMGWFCQGFGFGEIMLALQASQHSELTAEEILLLKVELGGWGEVWRHLAMLEQPLPTPVPPADETPTATVEGTPPEAAETQTPAVTATPQPEKVNNGNYCSDLTQQHPVGAKLAMEYGVPYEQVMGWFCRGYGMGEIMLVLQASQKSGLNPDQFFAMKQEQGGWGKVWQEMGWIGKARKTQPGQGEEPVQTPEATPSPETMTKPGAQPPAGGGKPADENPGKKVTPPGQNKPPKDKQPPANPGKGKP
ncbi:MAG: DUF5667 domain-containing protein [Bellilinea sp.]|nr:DUF5667 domain-containing protein [Bellilinea sp.]